jgi:hypothetical protein
MVSAVTVSPPKPPRPPRYCVENFWRSYKTANSSANVHPLKNMAELAEMAELPHTWCNTSISFLAYIQLGHFWDEHQFHYPREVDSQGQAKAYTPRHGIHTQDDSGL